MPRKSNGEGCIIQRKDGRWIATLAIDGVRKTAYGKTEKEARSKLLALQQEGAKTGALSNPGTRTVNDLLDAWLDAVSSNLRPKTIQNYRDICEYYIRPSIGTTRLSKLTPAKIQAFYNSLQAQGLKRVPKLAHTLLHKALSLAVLWGWLPNNPSDRVVKPTYTATRKEVWSLIELRTFLTSEEGHQFFPLWLMCIATGARLGEITGLQWRDVDFQSSIVTIRRTLTKIDKEWIVGSPKTKSGERTIELPSQAQAVLYRQKRRQAEWRLKAGEAWPNNDLVFTNRNGGALDPRDIAHSLSRACKRSGVREISPHGLRHLAASLMLAGNTPITDVSAMLGHSNPRITVETYAHVVKKHRSKAVSAMEKVLSQLGSDSGD